MANLVTGPIVGVVDESNYRVLVEVDAAQPLSVSLTDLDAPKSPRVSLAAQATAWRPLAVPLTGLIPGHRYSVTLTNLPGQPVATFRAIDASRRLRIGVVSCNDVGYRPKSAADDVWSDLAAAVEADELDLVIHCGDQIYADDVYRDANEYPDDDPLERVAVWFRNRYRETWRRPTTRRVLARVPNLMMWDDHEVVDDFGDLPEHRDGAAQAAKPAARKRIRRARQVAETAWNVCREYQGALHGGSPPGAPFGHEAHGHVFGPVAVFLLDARGGRAFQRDARYPYLSSAQWNTLSRFLSKSAKDARALVLVSPTPVVFLGPEWTDAHEGLPIWPDDLRGHWSYKEFAKEQRLLLQALDSWRQLAPGRQVLIVGGDVHVGHKSTIYKVEKNGAKRAIMQQLVASSISYRFLEGTEFWAFGSLLKNPEKGMLWNGAFRWEHGDLIWDHNFGVATITLGKKPSIELQLRT